MKKIIFIAFTLFSILMLNNNYTHAITINDVDFEPTRSIHDYSNSQYSFYLWEFYLSDSSQYYTNLGIVSTVNYGTPRVYGFRSDVTNYIEINYPSYQRIYLPALKYLVIEYSAGSATLTFYDDTNTVITQLLESDITNTLPEDNPVYIGYQTNLLNPEAYQAGYDKGYDDGYDTAEQYYGYYDGSDYITANTYGLNRYNAGFNEAESYYAYYYDEQYITALQYGQIRYNEGYELGLTNEIDWFNWAFTFITMPVRILNVEVLPGIKIGYFALFTLMTGIVSWFFFIVGKGGGRRK